MKNLSNFFGFGKTNAEKIYDLSKPQHYVHFIDRANGLLNDYEQAKNVVAEAFAAAYQKHESFESTEEIIFFLFNFINERCNVSPPEKDQMELIKDLILSKEKKSYPVTKELLKAVQEEIERLPRQCRLIFGLFFCGVGPAEVAGIVNRTKKTVMNQRRIACNRLRNALYERGLLSN